ncbi:methionine synthase [soil metagenome]
MTDPAWVPTGVATGIGSLPGTDPVEALRLVLDELPDFPHLPELPARGPGADLLGRTAALLPDLPVDLQPAGWRMVQRPGRDLRRAIDYLTHDLDTLEEHAGEYDGPVKLAVAGPWTLAAGIELHRGDKLLADHGAVRDLIQSLAQGLAGHVADVARRLPRATVTVQLDEPSLPAVLAARIPTASGYDTLRAVTEQDAETALRAVLGATGTAATVLHCCGHDAPIALLHRAGAHGLSLDATLLTKLHDEALGTAVEAGVALLLGVVESTDTDLPDVPASVAGVRALWGRLGFAPELLPGIVTLTPRCGLAGASPAYARTAMARCRDAATLLVDEPEG